jgi:hypothetical protein
MKKHVLTMILGFFTLCVLSANLLAMEGDAQLEVVELATLADLRAQEPGTTTVFKITGEVIVTFKQAFRNQIFIQDETAGILIDDNNGIIETNYDINNGITGITGTLGIFRNNLQFYPAADFGEPSSTGKMPTAVTRTLSELTASDQGRLVVVEELSFSETDRGTAFATGKNLAVTDPSGTGVFRTEFWNADYIGATIPETPRSVTGIVIMFNQTIQLVSRSLADLQITDMPSIKALRNQVADNETIYTLTGEAFLSYQQTFRNKKWIQDATAGIEIDDNSAVITTAYEIGDGITGIKGKLNLNRNMLQFVPTENPGDATSDNNELLVVERTLESLTSADQGRLVRINEVSFNESHFGSNFATGRNLTIADPTASGVFRTEFFQADYIGTPIPVIANNITAIVRQFDAVMQVTARSLEDFEAAGDIPTYDIAFTVYDESMQILTDAVITLGETTYDAGQHTIEDVIPGTYMFSINMDGYHPYSGQIIVSDENVALEVMLVAIDPAIVDVFPWNEGFEEGVPPAGWRVFRNPDFNSWISHPTANSGSAAAYHGSTGPGDQPDSWLVTPQIKLPEEETMLFSFFERNAFMNDYGHSGVWISTESGDPANDKYEKVYESNTPVGTYTERTINLSDYKGKIVYLAFVYRGADAHNWWIDDVSIDQAPDVFEVPNIAALREQAQADGSVYRITGQLIMTHKNGNRNQKYFQDETGAILIDDPRPSGSPVGTPGVITSNYEEYDAIVGLTGKISIYNQMWQLLPTEDPGEAVSKGNVVEPLVITVSQMSPEHQARLVEIKDVSIEIPDGQTNFASSRSYNITDVTGTAILRTPNANAGLDYFNTPIPTTKQHIVGIFVQFNNDLQISPRSLADFIDADDTKVVENENNTLLLFPNPARTHFTIQIQSDIDMIRVFDMNGRLMIHQTINDSQARIETSELVNGLYIVQVVTQGQIINHKLQVNH